MIILRNMILTMTLYKVKMLTVLASTSTHYQILVPANDNHTYFIAEWILKSELASRSDNYVFYTAVSALGTVAEKLDQLHLK